MGREQVGTQVVNVSENKYLWGELKAGEICRESIAAGLPVGFSVAKAVGCWQRSLGAVIVAAMCLLLVGLFFLVLSQYMSALPVTG